MKVWTEEAGAGGQKIRLWSIPLPTTSGTLYCYQRCTFNYLYLFAIRSGLPTPNLGLAGHTELHPLRPPLFAPCLGIMSSSPPPECIENINWKLKEN
jgi:hypothetical protein